MLSKELEGDCVVRDVGVYDDILWAFNGEEVVLWK
jgi:hypothetical protein